MLSPHNNSNMEINLVLALKYGKEMQNSHLLQISKAKMKYLEPDKVWFSLVYSFLLRRGLCCNINKILCSFVFLDFCLLVSPLISKLNCWPKNTISLNTGAQEMLSHKQFLSWNRQMLCCLVFMAWTTPSTQKMDVWQQENTSEHNEVKVW